MNKLLAQTPIKLGPDGGFRGFGSLGLEENASANSIIVFSNVISTTIGIITVVAIIWFLVQLMTGAVSVIGSGGDKGKIEQARTKIMTGITGLVVVVSGIFLADLIGSLVGFKILNLVEIITNLGKR